MLNRVIDYTTATTKRLLLSLLAGHFIAWVLIYIGNGTTGAELFFRPLVNTAYVLAIIGNWEMVRHVFRRRE